MKATKKMLALLGAAVTLGVYATPTVTVNAVRQRYPWNNNVDITYTVSGYTAATDKGGYAIKFKVTVPSYENGAEQNAGMVWIESEGTSTYTWSPDTLVDVADANCKLTAEVYDFTTSLTDGDYEIWDLAASPITNYYENVIVFNEQPNQELSNLRYNTDEYKTDKLVLRKVKTGGSYTVGADYSEFTNDTGDGFDLNLFKRHPKRTGVTVDKAYFIGVFQLTQYQYAKIAGEAAPAETSKLLPKHTISYSRLRNGAANNSTDRNANLDPTSDSFLGQLNAAVSDGNGNFELPTQNQWEIAAKGGQNATHPDWVWFFANDYATAAAQIGAYAQYKGNNNSAARAVGTKLPNELGLYDVYGNVWEWCRDTYVDAVNSTDTDTASYSGDANQASSYRTGTGNRALRGGSYNGPAGNCSSAYRTYYAASSAYAGIGVRLARAAE